MNMVLGKFLRKFVVVFFDDILIYSKQESDHVEHLQQVLHCLQTHSFYVKVTKCSFAQKSIEYLGHIIDSQGLKDDPMKVEAMTQWQTPTNVKQLKGFLGLTGYYRRFVKNYSTLTAPLTDLLKKGEFLWSEAATIAFEKLKKAMVEITVLRLPDFSIKFIVETDASGRVLELS